MQNMAGFGKGQWSGDKQLFWSGARPGDRLELAFETRNRAISKFWPHSPWHPIMPSFGAKSMVKAHSGRSIFTNTEGRFER